MRSHVNGIEIYYEVDGNGPGSLDGRLDEKPVLLVLHGGPGWDHTTLVEPLRPLVDVFQLLYVDLRGGGRSTWPPVEQCTPEAMVEDLEALRASLGIEPRWLNILGMSFGGAVGLTYATRYPDRLARLVVCSTLASHAGYDEAQRAGMERAAADQLEPLGHVLNGTVRNLAHLRTAWSQVQDLYYARFDEDWRGVAGGSRPNLQLMNWWARDGVYAYDVRPLLGAIRAPTLVMRGAHDVFTPKGEVDALLAGIPNACARIFERSGHLPQREEPETFLTAIRAFLAIDNAAETTRGRYEMPIAE